MYSVEQAERVTGYHNLSLEQWYDLSLAAKADLAFDAGVINLEVLILLDRPEHDESLCQLCHAQGNDKRYLQMRCMYAIDEVVPEMTRSEDSNLFGMNICKNCRADLLEALGTWRMLCIGKRAFPKDHDGNPLQNFGNIPVRRNGVSVMLTEEEYDQWVKEGKPGA